MATRDLLIAAEAKVNELERLLNDERRVIRACEREIAELRDQNTEVCKARDGHNRRVQSLALELRQLQAHQKPKLGAEARIKSRMQLPVFTVLRHPGESGYVDMYDGKTGAKLLHDNGAALRQMLQARGRSTIEAESLRPHAWMLSEVDTTPATPAVIEEGAFSALEEHTAIPTTEDDDLATKDLTPAQQEVYTTPTLSVTVLPDRPRAMLATRTPVCTYCFKFGLRCSAGAPCNNCPPSERKCVYKFCRHMADCRYTGRCHYIHPGQMEAAGVRRSVEHGALVARPEVMRPHGDSYRPSHNEDESPTKKRKVEHI